MGEYRIILLCYYKILWPLLKQKNLLEKTGLFDPQLDRK